MWLHILVGSLLAVNTQLILEYLLLSLNILWFMKCYILAIHNKSVMGEYSLHYLHVTDS